MKKPYAKHFAKPVIVQPGRIDRERVVTDVRDAAVVLLRDWPEDGVARQQAMKACIQVLHGKKPARVAREAFIRAAREAKVLLRA